LIFPTLDQIVDLNQELINRYGGFHNGLDNLRNRGSLEWVLEAIQYPLFENQIYPSIIEKAAILSWTINEGHVFHDGNKRTSVFIMLQFLRINGYQYISSTAELRDISKIIATSKQNKFTYQDYIEWVKNRVQPKS